MPPDADILAKPPEADADASARPLSLLPAWVTPEYFEQTRRVWQRYYAQPLTDDDVSEIIRNVSGLLGVLLEKPATVSGEQPEQKHEGAGKRKAKNSKGKRGGPSSAARKR